jgi:hypothetical protein
MMTLKTCFVFLGTQGVVPSLRSLVTDFGKKKYMKDPKNGGGAYYGN